MTKFEQCVRLVHGLDPSGHVEARYVEDYRGAESFVAEALLEDRTRVGEGRAATFEGAVEGLYANLKKEARRMRLALGAFDASPEGVAP